MARREFEAAVRRDSVFEVFPLIQHAREKRWTFYVKGSRWEKHDQRQCLDPCAAP